LTLFLIIFTNLLDFYCNAVYTLYYKRLRRYQMGTRRIKINDFQKMTEQDKRDFSDNGLMWMMTLDGQDFADDQYIICFDDCVVYKTGRTIDGVQMTDETCAWYEKRGNYYVDEEGNKIAKSVNGVCNHHYN
jgi:hypothetical protein